MCCFSGKVDVVADTNIFARASKDDRQFLVYSMSFAATADLAMILPIPTPKGSAEDAVKFISLKKYDAFFDDLRKGSRCRRRTARRRRADRRPRTNWRWSRSATSSRRSCRP